MKSLEESLQRLRSDYMDILLLHDIEFGSFEQVMEEGIPALQQLKKQGKIRFFGVSGLPLKIFDQVLAQTDLDVILSYCRYSLNDTSLLALLPLLEAKRVGLINASPLSMGLLSSRPVPEWHPARVEIKEACKRAAEHCASKGKDLSRLAIQFSVSHEQVPTTLVSTASTGNMMNNIQWTDEQLDHELLQEVQEILAPIHNTSWPSGRPEYQ